MAGIDNLKPFTSERQPKNPGKKKGTRNLKTIFELVGHLTAPAEIQAAYSIKNLKNNDALIMALYKRAMGGDVKAIQICMEYGIGKPKQDVSLSTDGSFNIAIVPPDIKDKI